MPVHEVTGPDGRKHRVTVPEGATKEDAIAYIAETQYDIPRESPAAVPETSPKDPSEPATNEDWNFLDDVVKPGWEEYDFYEDTVRPTKHIAKGVGKGLLEIGDLPHYLTAGQNWVAEKVFGEENLDALEERNLDFIRAPVYPRLTKTLEKYATTPYNMVAGSEYAEGEEVPGWAETGRVVSNWSSGGLLNAVRRGTMKAANPDLWQGALAGAGNIVDQYWGDTGIGELVAGITGTLLSLRKGDVSKLSKEDRIALDYIMENLDLQEGQTTDDVLRVITEKLSGDSPEFGSLAEIAKDRNIQDIQRTLSAADAQYGRALQRATEDRSRQILEGVEGQFEEFDPSVPETLRESARGRIELADQRIKTEAELAAEEMGVPLKKTEAETQFNKLLEEEANLAEAQRARQAASGELPEIRAQNFEATIPDSQTQGVFEGVNRADPEAMWQVEDDWWGGAKLDADGNSTGAFSEVRNYDGGFKLDERLFENLRQDLADPEIVASLKNYFGDSLKRIAAVRKVDSPNFQAEDFDMEAFIKELGSRNLTGDEMIALRNWFAINANRAADSRVANPNRSIVQRLDEIIESTLRKSDPAQADQFLETKSLYPSHLQNQAIMDKAATRMAYGDTPGVFGEYSLENYVRAGERYGFPNRLEENRQAIRNLGEAEAAEKAAKEAVNAQSTILRNAEKAAKEASKRADTLISQGDTEALGLARTRLAKFEKEPLETIQQLLRSSDPNSADSLSELQRVMNEAGSGSEFNALVGQAVVDMLDASKAGTRSSVLPKAARDVQRHITRLINSEILSPEQAEEVATFVERAVVQEYLAGGNARRLTEIELNEIERLATSMGAAAALRATTTGSTSLIVGNAYQRFFRRLLKGESAKHSTNALMEMTSNPQKFLDIAAQAKTEDEIVRLFLTEIVGATQAAELMKEEENAER